MCNRENGTSVVGGKHYADADDEVDQIGFEISEPKTGADGKDTPFRNEHEKDAEGGAAANQSDKNSAGAEQDVEDSMQGEAEGVAAFPHKNKVSHEMIIAY